MNKGRTDVCVKECQKKFIRQRAEIFFLREFMRKFPFHLSYRRMPTEEEKSQLISFVREQREIPVSRKLALISLSKSRFYGWQKKKHKRGCLYDSSSCPKRNPKKLMLQEVIDIRSLVERKDLYEMLESRWRSGI